MRTLPYFVVDAFTSTVFKGNPAGVCPLEAWLPDSLMQEIAAENNLSETAFFTLEGAKGEIRWFTPNGEVDLCGHATLASGFVAFECLGVAGDEITFDSKSGPLVVRRSSGALTLDFPARSPESVVPPPELRRILSAEPLAVFSGRDLFVELESEEAVRRFVPDLSAIRGLPGLGFVITARGDHCDFVSRAFFPKEAIPEDPVTGSTHTVLAPYWARKLGKTSFAARQLSRRGGELQCELKGGRVEISGSAALYSRGEIYVP